MFKVQIGGEIIVLRKASDKIRLERAIKTEKTII